MSEKLVSSMEMMLSLMLLLLVVSVSGQGSPADNDIPTIAPALPSESQLLFPSDMPSTVPTMLPSSVKESAAPSDTPSNIPSDVPSLIPSMVPSDAPSAKPSGFPSSVPSDAPSSIPTPRPSQQPSLFPSVIPTTTPTFTPTSSPSWQPSNRPSTVPSVRPSTTPTIACHDDANYLSPINDFTCSDFRGTDCTAWRFVGLDVTDLETLVESCPISCGIDCGSLERFEVKVTFRLYPVLNFLDSASVGTLEETSVEYLSNYVENLKPASKFFLYEAELTAQQIQASHRAGDGSANRNLLRRTQEVEPQSNDLIVTVAFRGLAIVLGNAVINALLVQGIDSAGYSRAIQRSGDPTFLDIEVTSSVTDDSDASKNSTKRKGEGDGPSPGGTAAAVLTAFSFVGLGIGYFIKKRRTETKGKAIAKMQEESEAQLFTSAPGSPRSAAIGSLSFEGSPGVVAGILRIMSSGSPRSNDSSTRSGQTSKQSSKASMQESDGTTSSQSEEEHPYTGIIPPMIVIDNLDETETSPSSTKKGGNRNVVPYQRLHASVELVAALNGTSNAYDPSVFQGELFSQSLVARSESRSSSDQSRSLSPGRFSRVWDSDAEDGSAGSIITSSYTKDELDAILDQQQPLDTDLVAAGANNGLRVTTDLRPASRGSNRSSRDSPNPYQSSSPRSDTSSRCKGYVSSPERERSFSNASTVLQGQLSGEPPAPAEKLKEGGGFIQSFWHRSPGKAMPKIMSLPSLNGGTSSDNNSGTHSRHGSKGSSLNDDLDESVRHIFWAPRKGKLGLVIECKISGGPVVVQVKDYSPLLGQVLRGDKIAKIDNVSTLHMTLAEVTNLLGGGGKTSYLRGPVIQFVVLRDPNMSAAPGSFEYENSPSIGSLSQGGSFSDMFTPSDSLPTPK